MESQPHLRNELCTRLRMIIYSCSGIQRKPCSNILTKIDDYAKIFNQYVDTDLSVGNLAWLGTEVLKMGVDKIDFSTLPNEWRSPYIYLIPDETLTLVNTYLNPYVEDRTAEDLHLPS